VVRDIAGQDYVGVEVERHAALLPCGSASFGASLHGGAGTARATTKPAIRSRGASLRGASMGAHQAATPTMSTLRLPLPETRATRTRASGRLVGCAFKYSVKTPRMARSAFACDSAAASTGNPGT
jgi:hypothetical protein